MAKFTLLEIHLDGAEFTANAPFSDSGESDDSPDIEVGEVGDEESSGGPSWLPAVVGLVFLVVVAVVAKKKLGGSDEDEPVPELEGRA